MAGRRSAQSLAHVLFNLILFLKVWIEQDEPLLVNVHRVDHLGKVRVKLFHDIGFLIWFDLNHQALGRVGIKGRDEQVVFMDTYLNDEVRTIRQLFPLFVKDLPLNWHVVSLSDETLHLVHQFASPLACACAKLTPLSVVDVSQLIGLDL